MLSQVATDSVDAKARGRDELLAEIGRSYYEQDLTQAQVAKMYGISRSQVSRYLRAARDEGIVQISIVPPHGRDADTEAMLRRAYPHLREVHVVRVFNRETAFVRHAVARAAAKVFSGLIRPGHTVCLGAGRTMATASGLVAARHAPGVIAVPATGDAGHAALESDYSAVTRRVAHALAAVAYRINAPAILGAGASSAQLEQANPQIREALAAARSADMYLLGIGSLAGDDIFVRTGLVSAEELDQVRAAGGVGDLCGNFFDSAGQGLSEPFHDRIVGLSLDDLSGAALAIACGAGPEKVAAINGALKGRLINGLVTDEHTAMGVLAGVGGGASGVATTEPVEGEGRS